jgi:hypothetical protein
MAEISGSTWRECQAGLFSRESDFGHVSGRRAEPRLPVASLWLGSVSVEVGYRLGAGLGEKAGAAFLRLRSWKALNAAVGHGNSGLLIDLCSILRPNGIHCLRRTHRKLHIDKPGNPRCGRVDLDGYPTVTAGCFDGTCNIGKDARRADAEDGVETCLQLIGETLNSIAGQHLSEQNNLGPKNRLTPGASWRQAQPAVIDHRLLPFARSADQIM